MENSGLAGWVKLPHVVIIQMQSSLPSKSGVFDATSPPSAQQQFIFSFKSEFHMSKMVLTLGWMKFTKYSIGLSPL